MQFRRCGSMLFFLLIICFIIIIIDQNHQLNQPLPTVELLSVIKKIEKFRILSNEYSSVK